MRLIDAKKRTDDDFSFSGFNKKVGTLKINENFNIVLYKKMPNRFHRFMAKILLGWIYEECNNE